MVKARTKARIEARILERAAHCVQFELSDPRSAFITLTRAEISDDLAVARVFYSVFGSQADKAKVAHMLQGASGFIQRQILRVLEMRRAPRITWMYDDSIERGAAMDRLIGDALARDKAINPHAHEARAPAPAPSADEIVAHEHQESPDGQGVDGGIDADNEPAH